MTNSKGLYSVEALGIKAFQSTCLATEHQNCNGLEAVSCIIKAIKRSGTAANTRKAEDQACLNACFRVILQSSNILISDRGHLQPSAGSPDCVRATPAVSELCLVHCALRGISSSLVNAASIAARSNAVLRLPGVTVPLNAHCSIYSMAQPKQVLLRRQEANPGVLGMCSMSLKAHVYKWLQGFPCTSSNHILHSALQCSGTAPSCLNACTPQCLHLS